MIRSLFLGAIRLYQYLVSPLTGPVCRFYPSCSAYAHEAVRLHGVPKGLCLGLRRILRCHPYHPGGYDPVPRPGPANSKTRLENS